MNISCSRLKAKSFDADENVFIITFNMRRKRIPIETVIEEPDDGHVWDCYLKSVEYTIDEAGDYYLCKYKRLFNKGRLCR
jgi:hypothetical protein